MLCITCGKTYGNRSEYDNTIVTCFYGYCALCGKYLPLLKQSDYGNLNETKLKADGIKIVKGKDVI